VVVTEKREPGSRSRLPALAASLAAFLLYAFTCYPSPDWLDGPELAGAALRLGIFHPPGSPLAVLAGHIAVLWPFGPPAGALVYFSAVFAAASVYVMTRIIQEAHSALGSRDSARGHVFAFLTGLTFAVTPVVWSQALRLEVYTLALLLFLLSLRSLLAIGRAADLKVAGGKAERALFFCGLGVATHPLIALSALAGVPVLAASGNGWRFWLAPRRMARLAASFLLGCAPLFLLPLMVRGPVDLRWGDPTTLSGFVKFVSGSTFGHSFSLMASGPDGSELKVLAALARGLGIPLVVAATIGIYLLARTRPRLALMLSVVTVASTLGLALQRGFRLDNPDVGGYLLAATASLFLLAALGLTAVAGMLAVMRPRTAWLVVALWPGLALGSVLAIERPLDRSGCTAGRALAARALTDLPKGTVALLADFNLVFMFDYLQQAESLRRDVQVFYLRDLGNPALRTALAEKDPELAALLPRSSILDLRSLLRLSRRRPLTLDLGPHLADELLEVLQPGGLLWMVRENGLASEADALRIQSAFFADFAPPLCGPGEIDRRSAEVISWHSYWQALAARAKGMDVVADAMLSCAACASPADKTIARAAAGRISFSTPWQVCGRSCYCKSCRRR